MRQLPVSRRAGRDSTEQKCRSFLILAFEVIILEPSLELGIGRVSEELTKLIYS